MRDMNNLTPEQLKAELAKIRDERNRRYAYNKKHRASHPMTEEQKQQRLAYAKSYRQTKKVKEQKIIERAIALGLLSSEK